ncbi:MAG: AraC family transcriptional regulator [Pseudomonadota bacterium]|nr:AraC family transcriptional regulator [Pseudomonadota bacterium]
MTTRPSFTVSGASIVALVAYAKMRGADLAPTLAELGLARLDLTNPESRVELPASDHLWNHAAALSGDADFGLSFAGRMDLDAFHLVGHLAASSRTLGHAIERIVAFSRLLHDAGRTEIARLDGERTAFFPGCRGLTPPPSRHIAEFSTASVVLLARLITGEPGWCPVEVRFQHAAPLTHAAHTRLFGVAPVFGAPETLLVLDPRALALPVRVSRPSAVGQYLEGYARTLLARLPEAKDDAPAAVRRALLTGLTQGRVGVDDIAARLGTTPRTLQRRLAAEGTGFAALLDEVRREVAERYLGDPALPLAEISFLLGFGDPSNFQKAFRRWTGTSPGAWRERAGAI